MIPQSPALPADFAGALAALLSDGALRIAFQRSPAELSRRLCRCPDEANALACIDPSNLDFQAEILIRKRWKEILRILPETCSRLANRAWPEYRSYAIATPLQTNAPHFADTIGFLNHLETRALIPPNSREANQVRFLAGNRRLACFVVRPRHPGHASRFPALQILLRRGSSRIFDEWIIRIS